MAYIVSYESASVEFPKWIRTKNGLDVKGSVVIKGGANVIDKKTMQTPKGIMTEVSKEDLEFLKTQSLFNEKVEQGSYEIVESEKKAEEKIKKNKRQKDGGAQLVAQDFIDADQQPPLVGAKEEPDDGSILKKQQEEE